MQAGDGGKGLKLNRKKVRSLQEMQTWNEKCLQKDVHNSDNRMKLAGSKVGTENCETVSLKRDRKKLKSLQIKKVQMNLRSKLSAHVGFVSAQVFLRQMFKPQIKEAKE